MKTNEVPEKIYLPIDDSLKTYARKDSDEEIEYTRTDAFIDKAIEWFEQNLHMYNTSECLGDKKEFIEDFKKAMEL